MRDARINRKLAFGVGASGAVNFIKAGLQILMVPLMGRLLGPSEFGLYALALPTIGLLSTVADGGFGVSLAREPESGPIWSTAFWVTLGSGVAMAVGVAGWGFVLGRIMHQPRVAELMALLSVSLALMGLSVCPRARLVRRGRLDVFAGADLASSLSGAVVGVALALDGAGAMSLAAQFVTVYGIEAIVLNAAAFHRPRCELRLALLRGHVATGGAVLGARAADFAGKMVENGILGRTLGTAPLGVYTFANQVSRFVCEAAGNPVWTTLYMTAIHAEPASLPAIHARFSRLLGAVLFPAVFLIDAASPDLVSLLLGPQWTAAAPMLQILLPTYVLSTLASQGGAVLLARNRYGLQLLCTAGLSIGRILVVCAGPWIGLFGVSYGIAVVNVLYAAAMLVVSGGALSVARGFVGPCLSSVPAAAVCWVIVSSHTTGWLWLLTGLGLGAGTYVAARFLGDRSSLRDDYLVLRQAISG